MKTASWIWIVLLLTPYPHHGHSADYSKDQASQLNQQAQQEDNLAQNIGNSDSLGALKNDYKKICPEDSPTVVAGDNNAVTLKKKYCESAKQALEGAKKNDQVWKVYTGVATVCTTTCAKSYLSGGVVEVGGFNLCSATSITGSVAVAAITKEYQALVMSLGMELGKKVFMGSGDSAKDEFLNKKAQERMTEEQKTAAANEAKQREADAKEFHEKHEKDTGSCITAATMAYQAYSTYESIKGMTESIKENLKKAADIKGDRAGIAAMMTDSNTRPSSTPSSNTETLAQSSTSSSASTSGDSSSQSLGTSSSDALPSGDPCASTDGGLASAVSCATAGEGRSDLPDFVHDPQFENEFQKATNQTSELFFDDHTEAASALAGAIPAALSAATQKHLNSEQRARLSAGLSQLQQGAQEMSIRAGVTGSAYVGGGSDNKNRSGDDDEFDEMMDRMRSGSRDLSQGSRVQDFGGKKTGVKKAIEDDPTVNLFDRITVRYQILNKRHGLAPVRPLLQR